MVTKRYVFGQVGVSMTTQRYSTDILRGGIVNRTYGTHKNIHIFIFLLKKIDPLYYGPP